ncbi:MAG: molecular chaperone DnaJ [Gammaproteobacteria bacterium]|nr:molecular chaperone DnaJ [Gammaproteobacteria bacterium]
MARRDYYEILSVPRDVSDADLKKAYRRVAMKCHPDRNPSDLEAEARFKEAKEAFEILKNPRKRAAYDQFGHAGVEAAGGRASGDAFGDIFGDVFGDIFGGGRRGRSQAYQGADLRYEHALGLEQAVFGETASIEVPTLIECEECGGGGSKKGTSPETCSTCGGHGQVRMQQGFFTVQQTCPHCNGRGRIVTHPCEKCHGQGRYRQTRTLSVKIPPGVDSGDRIRLAGEGEAGRNGGSPGDLFVEVRVKPHEIFERDGRNLSCEIPVSFATLALGATVDVPTLDGQVSLKLPPETQSGRVFRVRGKGVKPVRGGTMGDLFCRVHVETPVNLTAEQTELLARFDDSVREGGDRHSPRARSWLDGVKQFFDKIGTG